MGKKYLYKFLRAGLKSQYDGSQWEIGKWREVSAPDKECVGLNASEYVMDAMHYVQGEVLAKVECRGKIIEGDDKWTCQAMRIVAVADWGWRESVGMAVYAARLALPVWQKNAPWDDLVEKAIEAAEEVLAGSSGKKAWSAALSAADAAWNAAAAAWNAAAAARSAEDAAWNAAAAARSAARSAAAAAWSAALSAADAARRAEAAAWNAAAAARSAADAAGAAAGAVRQEISFHALSLVKWRRDKEK